MNILVLCRGDEANEIMSKFQPLARTGLPEHIGQAVVFLTSDTTGYFATGTDFIIDGGLMLNPFHGLAALGMM